MHWGVEFKTVLSSLKAIYPFSFCFSEQVKSEDNSKTKWGNNRKIMVKALQKSMTKSLDSYLQLFWKHQSDGNKPENCIHMEQGRRKTWQLPKTRGRLAWCCPSLSHRPHKFIWKVWDPANHFQSSSFWWVLHISLWKRLPNTALWLWDLHTSQIIYNTLLHGLIVCV